MLYDDVSGDMNSKGDRRSVMKAGAAMLMPTEIEAIDITGKSGW